MIKCSRTKQKAARIFSRFRACFHGGWVDDYLLYPKGGESVTVFEAIMIALTFGLLIVNLVKLVADMVKNKKR